MPSRLLNLRYALKWEDFQGSVPADAEDWHNAETHAEIVYGAFALDRVDGGVRLRDNVTITVTLHRDRSWVRPGQKTDALLHHEQGHYNIAALTARDIFIDIMALKEQTFANAGELQRELNRIQGSYVPQRVQNKYDAHDEADHGRNAEGQRRWDGYIRTAFTVERSPRMLAPDGTAYKRRLREVLRQAGHHPIST